MATLNRFRIERILKGIIVESRRAPANTNDAKVVARKVADFWVGGKKPRRHGESYVRLRNLSTDLILATWERRYGGGVRRV